MCEADRITDVQEDAQVVDQRFVPDHVAPGGSADQFHGVERLAVGGLVKVMDGDDVRVVQFAGDQRLGNELLLFLGVSANAWLNHLNRYFAIDRFLDCLIDDTYATFTEHPEQIVAFGFQVRWPTAGRRRVRELERMLRMAWTLQRVPGRDVVEVVTPDVLDETGSGWLIGCVGILRR